MRLVELALFLSPFAVFAIWRLTAGRGGPSPLLLAIAAAGLVVLAVLLVRYASQDTLERGEAYAPARLEGGRIIAGHAAEAP